MPPVQTTYAANQRKAVVGMIANQETWNGITRLVGDADGIGFGVAVYQHADEGFITADPAAGPFVGFTVRDITLESAAPNLDKLPYRREASILTMGVIWAIASVIVAQGDKVYTTAGKALTNVANGNTALDRSTFDSDAAAAALVKVRVK